MEIFAQRRNWRFLLFSWYDQQGDLCCVHENNYYIKNFDVNIYVAEHFLRNDINRRKILKSHLSVQIKLQKHSLNLKHVSVTENFFVTEDRGLSCKLKCPAIAC
jgi:hypothetical protein